MSLEAIKAKIPAWHTVTRDWEGETAYIVGGGPSVLTCDIERLRGRKVIAINSSYERVIFADYLVYNYGDLDWWRTHRRKAGKTFRGGIVTPSPQLHHDRRLFMRKRKPPGLTLDPDALTMRETTFTAAINLAVHLGVKRIVLLGADGRMSGSLSHHYVPSPGWAYDPDRWDRHRDELRTLVKPLNDLGIETLNASPGSAWDMWPVVEFGDCL